MTSATVIGAGLAGCEAANTLANNGVLVTLIEQKPNRKSAAHKLDSFAELVCSNSLKSSSTSSAAGLLKAEMRLMGSLSLEAADICAVAAGGALAVDRLIFSDYITKCIKSNKNINIVAEQAAEIDDSSPVIVATGPLTDGELAVRLCELCGEKALSFYDAAAPIVSAGSIDMERVSAACRYGKGTDDYLNCFFDKAGYEHFWGELVAAKTAQLHSFDEEKRVYEGCMPIERLAQRGIESVRYGPMKPVGLVNPQTGHRPWAAVQLRRENEEGTMYNIVGFQTNLTFPEQKRVFSLIPGLENAEFVRYGVMHRNSFLNSPKVLLPTLNLRTHENVFIAGQLTGFEGYMESASCGILAARFLLDRLKGKVSALPPKSSMCGALLRYITAENKDFQPLGANMGILPPLGEQIRDKRLKYEALANRALLETEAYLNENSD